MTTRAMTGVRREGPPQASSAPLLEERGSAPPEVREATSVGAGLRFKSLPVALACAALIGGCSSVGVGIGVPLAPGVSIGVGVSGSGVTAGVGTSAGPVGAGVGVNQRGQVTGHVGVGASVPVGSGGARAGVGVGTGTVLYDPNEDLKRK